MEDGDSWGQWCGLCHPLRSCPESIHQAWGRQSSLDHWQISILSWPHPHLLEAGDVTQCVRKFIKLPGGNFLKLTFEKKECPWRMSSERTWGWFSDRWKPERKPAAGWMSLGHHWGSPGQPPLPASASRCILQGVPTTVPPPHSRWSVLSETAYK